MSERPNLSISFLPTPESKRLYNRILSSTPKHMRMAEHARALLQKGLDCTCAGKDPKAKISTKKRNAGDGL